MRPRGGYTDHNLFGPYLPASRGIRTLCHSSWISPSHHHCLPLHTHMDDNVPDCLPTILTRLYTIPAFHILLCCYIRLLRMLYDAADNASSPHTCACHTPSVSLQRGTCNSSRFPAATCWACVVAHRYCYHYSPLPAYFAVRPLPSTFTCASTTTVRLLPPPPHHRTVRCDAPRLRGRRAGAWDHCCALRYAQRYGISRGR